MEDMEDVLKNEGRSKGGRTSLYSDALAEKIVELIEEGYSERQIEAMDGMPSRRTMLRWKVEHPEFCRLSARARVRCLPLPFLGERDAVQSAWVELTAPNY